MSNYQIRIDVTVHDRAALAACARSKALAAHVTEDEFRYLQAQAYEAETEIEFWLGWVFDAGTPPNCGFDIEESETIFQS